MTSEEYILSKLHDLSTSPGSVRFTATANLEDRIFRAVMSKKFRKYNVSESYTKYIRSSIAKSVKENKPIRFVFVFGGYKLWRLPQAPEPDWAELFALMYYTRWLKSVCGIYEPGVTLDLYSDDVVVEPLNNIPTEDVRRYIEVLRSLIVFLRPYQPSNMNITLTQLRDQYSSTNEFLDELESYRQLLVEGKAEGIPMTRKIIKSMLLNVKPPTGDVINSDQFDDIHLTHSAYTLIPRHKEYILADSKIRVSPLTAHTSLAVGTTKSSIVKFWVGVGALKRVGDNFNQLVVPPSHVDAWLFDYEQIDIGLGFKNFSKIPILL